MGHPILRQVAEQIDAETLRSAAFQRLCEDMLETMDDYEGVGLAAPQVHVPLRVVVLELSEDRGAEFLINPTVTALTIETTRTWEGCLSVEGIRAAVERPVRIIVEALERDGSEKKLELSGFPAVVVQHECDHLDGILYIDKCDTKTMSFLPEYRRFGPGARKEAEATGEDDLEDFHTDEVSVAAREDA